MDSPQFTNTSTTLPEGDEGSAETTLATGLPQIISTVVTISFLGLALAAIYAIYRLCCKTRSKHDGSAEGSSKRKDFFDQFDVNCSQMNIESEERKFTNPAAKITSESESTTSNASSTTADTSNMGLHRLVKTIHGSNNRFAVSRVRERSSRPSSLKIKIPKSFANSEGDDDQFAIALIDRRSNTIHNLDLQDCLVVDKRRNSAGLTPASTLSAQRWKEKALQKRGRRSSVEGRSKFLPRQASCPHAMSAKAFQSESTSSHSNDSITHNDLLDDMTVGVSLSSIDEGNHKLYDSAAFTGPYDGHE